MDKIRSPISGEVLRGDAYHKAVAHAYANIVIYKECPILDEVLQVYSDSWDKRLNDRITIDEGEEIYVPSIDFKDKDPGKIKDDGAKLLEIYYNAIMPNIIPHEVEVKKTAEHEGIPLLSYIDLITEKQVVCDHKVKAKMFSEVELIKDMQPTFYGLVLGVDKLDFHYHAAIATKEPHIEIVPVRRSKNDLDWVGELIVAAWSQINAGLFAPSPAGWWCAPDTCPYWSYCHIPKSF